MLKAVNAFLLLLNTGKPAVLKKRADFLRVAADPKKVSTRTLVLLKAPNDSELLRVGYTVTKKTSKLAVERNKIKRRLRALANELLPQYGQMGCDYVIIGKRDALTREFKELRGDLKYALKKIMVA